jgi:hypothetical protein
MALIQEMRGRQTAPPPHQVRSGMLSTVIMAVVAFAIGGLAVTGWKMLPPKTVALMTTDASRAAAPVFEGVRLGRSHTAPVLKACMPADLEDMPPQLYLKTLELGDTQSRVRKMLGAKDPAPRGDESPGARWGEMADCVFRQNSWALCDIDNRALAVQTAIALARHAANDPDASAVEKAERARLGPVRDRIFETLRARLRNGELIAADFGSFMTPELKRVILATPSERNACSR